MTQNLPIMVACAELGPQKKHGAPGQRDPYRSSLGWGISTGIVPFCSWNSPHFLPFHSVNLGDMTHMTSIDWRFFDVV